MHGQSSAELCSQSFALGSCQKGAHSVLLHEPYDGPRRARDRNGGMSGQSLDPAGDDRRNHVREGTREGLTNFFMLIKLKFKAMRPFRAGNRPATGGRGGDQANFHGSASFRPVPLAEWQKQCDDAGRVAVVFARQNTPLERDIEQEWQQWRGKNCKKYKIFIQKYCFTENATTRGRATPPKAGCGNTAGRAMRISTRILVFRRSKNHPRLLQP